MLICLCMKKNEFILDNQNISFLNVLENAITLCAGNQHPSLYLHIVLFDAAFFNNRIGIQI